jgi:hypothetical protein
MTGRGAFVLLAAFAACQSDKAARVDFSETPREYISKDYGEVYERWTRHDFVSHDAEKAIELGLRIRTEVKAPEPAVVFDLYNEPHDISWACWRDGCTTSGGWQAAGFQSLVNAVRATGATQPVLVAGNGWAGDLSSWLTYRPTDPAHQLAADLADELSVSCADFVPAVIKANGLAKAYLRPIAFRTPTLWPRPRSSRSSSMIAGSSTTSRTLIESSWGC